MCQVFVFYTFSYLMFIFRISTNNSTITLLFQLLHFVRPPPLTVTRASDTAAILFLPENWGSETQIKPSDAAVLTKYESRFKCLKNHVSVQRKGKEDKKDKKDTCCGPAASISVKLDPWNVFKWKINWNLIDNCFHDQRQLVNLSAVGLL